MQIEGKINKLSIKEKYLKLEVMYIFKVLNMMVLYTERGVRDL